jgi:hypothetical protein
MVRDEYSVLIVRIRGVEACCEETSAIWLYPNVSVQTVGTLDC